MSNACRTKPPVVVEVAKPPPRNCVVRLTVYRKDNTTIDLDSPLMTKAEAYAEIENITQSEDEARAAIRRAS